MLWQTVIVKTTQMRSTYRTIASYQTRDGSEIRELMHPAVHTALHCEHGGRAAHDTMRVLAGVFARRHRVSLDVRFNDGIAAAR